MPGNSLGKLFKITTFGESHGNALGVVIDGMPPKVKFNKNDLISDLQRRAPGKHQTATARKENDEPEILSGIFEDQTLGTPISVIVKNHDQKSSDYDHLKNINRPGHADLTTQAKFGFRDHRGGGRASGRETVSRVIAGYFAGLVLPTEIIIHSFITKIGEHHYTADEKSEPQGYFHTPTDEDDILTNYLLNLKDKGESCGGEITLYLKNVPAGLGDPVFDKLKATLAHGMLSIGSCIGFEVGLGKEFTEKLGSQISKDSKNFGGIEGGISNGDTIKLKLSFKAPSTTGEKAKEGRHDPCILPRVLVVVEAMAKIILADHYLRQKSITR